MSVFFGVWGHYGSSSFILNIVNLTTNGGQCCVPVRMGQKKFRARVAPKLVSLQCSLLVGARGSCGGGGGRPDTSDPAWLLDGCCPFLAWGHPPGAV